MRRYGAEAPALLAHARPGSTTRRCSRRSPTGSATTMAELLWGVAQEGALDVDDLLDRRTRIGLVPADRVLAEAAAAPRSTSCLTGARHCDRRSAGSGNQSAGSRRSGNHQARVSGSASGLRPDHLGAGEVEPAGAGQEELGPADAAADDRDVDVQAGRVDEQPPAVGQADGRDAAVLHAGLLDRPVHREERRLADVEAALDQVVDVGAGVGADHAGRDPLLAGPLPATTTQFALAVSGTP